MVNGYDIMISTFATLRILSEEVQFEKVYDRPLSKPPYTILIIGAFTAMSAYALQFPSVDCHVSEL